MSELVQWWNHWQGGQKRWTMELEAQQKTGQQGSSHLFIIT